MTILLQSLTILFFVSLTVILQIQVWVRDRKLTMIEDSVHLYVRQMRGHDWNDITHDFVQSIKIALKGEA